MQKQFNQNYLLEEKPRSISSTFDTFWLDTKAYFEQSRLIEVEDF